MNIVKYRVTDNIENIYIKLFKNDYYFLVRPSLDEDHFVLLALKVEYKSVELKMWTN